MHSSVIFFHVCVHFCNHNPDQDSLISFPLQVCNPVFSSRGFRWLCKFRMGESSLCLAKLCRLQTQEVHKRGKVKSWFEFHYAVCLFYSCLHLLEFLFVMEIKQTSQFFCTFWNLASEYDPIFSSISEKWRPWGGWQSWKAFRFIWVSLQCVCMLPLSVFQIIRSCKKWTVFFRVGNSPIYSLNTSV